MAKQLKLPFPMSEEEKRKKSEAIEARIRKHIERIDRLLDYLKTIGRPTFE